MTRQWEPEREGHDAKTSSSLWRWGADEKHRVRGRDARAWRSHPRWVSNHLVTHSPWRRGGTHVLVANHELRAPTWSLLLLQFLLHLLHRIGAASSPVRGDPRFPCCWWRRCYCRPMRVGDWFLCLSLVQCDCLWRFPCVHGTGVGATSWVSMWMRFQFSWWMEVQRCFDDHGSVIAGWDAGCRICNYFSVLIADAAEMLNAITFTCSLWSWCIRRVLLGRF